MKFNWGARIAVLYSGFVVMIITLVAATFRSKQVLVTEDYYLRETRFQEQLNAGHAAAQLEAPPRVIRSQDSVVVLFPPSLSKVRLQGTITCYFPANKDADRRIAFTSDNGAVSFKAPESSSGAYQLQIDWTGRGVHYYYQIR